jgi:hypothetical protein
LQGAGLPLLEILLGLGKLRDVRGFLEGDDLATTGQGNWRMALLGNAPDRAVVQ